MPYTTEEGGLLNNFAKEPPMYRAEPTSASQKRNYVVAAALGGALVVGLIAVATILSSAR
jgi:hypothetical protein